MRAATFLSFLLLLLLLATTSLSADGPTARKALVDGWKPIKGVNDPHIQDIAGYAVAEHNKAANAHLALIKVVSGETQVVAGVIYKLVVEAKDGGAAAAKKYEAVVWEKEWEKFRQVTSFKPVKA